MKTVKMLLVAGMFATLTSVSAVAVPFDITFTGGTPLRYWGTGWAAEGDLQFKDIVNVTSQSREEGVIHLAGINSILVTWDASVGYVYVELW